MLASFLRRRYSIRELRNGCAYLLSQSLSFLSLIKAGDQGDANLQDPPNQGQHTRLTMAKSTIDLFPFLKQRKAVISSVNPCKGKLMILAESGYELWRDAAKVWYPFRREIKEDI